jgi:glycosyltransferase involved in cell wall biosynthesis
MKLPISLVIITKNEESHIESCIKSADFVSEVIVVDSGSVDKTRAIAERLGAKVFEKEWLGFGPQKHWAVAQASFDWVLCLDADERISEELRAEILEKFEHLDPQTLYRFSRVSAYLGKWIWHGGWFPDFQGRLFNRRFFQWNLEPIHERVVGGSKQGHFMGPLEHYVFESVSDQMETNLRYAKLLSERDTQSGRPFFRLQLVIKPFVKFIECYFLKQGFRDGWPGFIIAINAAHSMFMRLCFRYETYLKKAEIGADDKQQVTT